jgi:hypothetical protein
MSIQLNPLLAKNHRARNKNLVMFRSMELTPYYTTIRDFSNVKEPRARLPRTVVLKATVN